jgi:Tfp pilus assembly protein PilW
MKIIKNDDGFTLIEILVTMNLTIIAITLIVSFYLFASKFIKAATNHFEKEQKINQFAFNLQDIINKSNGFNILINQNIVLITLESGKKLVFTDSTISLDDYYELKDTQGYNFLINLEDGENIAVNTKAESSIEQREINAGKIANMNITIAYNDKQYNIIYNKPMISSLRFININ